MAAVAAVAAVAARVAGAVAPAGGVVADVDGDGAGRLVAEVTVVATEADPGTSHRPGGGGDQATTTPTTTRTATT